MSDLNAEHAPHQHCSEGACEACDCCGAGWCVALQDGDPRGLVTPEQFDAWCDAVLESWQVEPRTSPGTGA